MCRAMWENQQAETASSCGSGELGERAYEQRMEWKRLHKHKINVYVCMYIIIPWTGYNKLVTKFEKLRRNHRGPYKVYIYIYKGSAWGAEATQPCLFVCLYTRELVSHILRYQYEISHKFLPNKLLICRYRRNRTTLAHSWHANWPIKIKKTIFYTLLCCNKCTYDVGFVASVRPKLMFFFVMFVCMFVAIVKWPKQSSK